MIPTHRRCAFPSCPSLGDWLLLIDGLEPEHHLNVCRSHAQRILAIVDMVRVCDVTFERQRS